MLVISDTTAITNLTAIKHLELLHLLYGEIVIPEAVKRELTEPGMSNPGAREVWTESWILVRPITNRQMVAEFLTDNSALDIGEAEAIVLAIELDADLLLIDDRIGRRVAERQGLAITGVLGALLDAKKQAVIPAVRPLIDDL